MESFQSHTGSAGGYLLKHAIYFAREDSVSQGVHRHTNLLLNTAKNLWEGILGY